MIGHLPDIAESSRKVLARWPFSLPRTDVARMWQRNGDEVGVRARIVGRLSGVLALVALCAPPAHAEFPYNPQGTPGDYSEYRLPAGAGKTPGDLAGKLSWMYAATAAPGADPAILADRRELNGIRGAHLADPADVDQAWRTTTGRPDVTIAVLDSGIKWNDRGAMEDIARKTRLSTGEAPVPQADRTTALVDGADCAAYLAASGRDLNGDGVFNVTDYACDSRVSTDPAAGVGPAEMLDPQDILIAFSDGTDGDGNGYVDDMVGWDFLDDDNDPFDDVQYGHGTGEARDSAGEAGNGGDLGACPNCMEIHLRVGTSFIADVNRFALAVLYATDNDVDVVQEALGTLNKSRIGGDAVKYAYDHGTTVIASAADEAAQHHNWPSSYPYAIVVNSVTHTDDAEPATRSYLAFNGCTNFSSRITLAIPSVSCSSDATGRGSGMAGIIYSAALNAIEAGRLEPHPTCRRTDGDPCPISPNEVRQLMASGTVGGEALSDDVNFAQTPSGQGTELSCQPLPVPACTNPFLAAPTTRAGDGGASYPARKGHDQFYGYGRVNMNRAVDALMPPGTAGSRVPPEVEITSPGWYDMVDPARGSLKVTGHVASRQGNVRCTVLVAPGSYASDVTDFVAVPSGVCNGDWRSGRVDGVLADIAMSDLKKLFPANAGDFRGREPGTGEQTNGGRPNTEPYGFIVKVVASAAAPGGTPVTGQDRRQAYLHRDADMLPGFPKQLPGDGEASPVLYDIDGDNQNELVIANSDGLVHVFRRDGSQLPGFPVHTDPLPMHPHSRAVRTGEVAEAFGAVLATPAVGDLDRDGAPEIVVADLESKVYVIGADGRIVRRWRTPIEYSGKPLTPFANVRQGKQNRTQHGFIGAPVLSDLDGDGRPEIIAAAMDRHVYAWHADGSDVPGWPVLAVDRSKVESIDAVTHQVTFKADAGARFDQGAIVATPAVGDLDRDGTPEVVVGTNESYAEPLNAGGLESSAYAPLGAALTQANGRLFAFDAKGELEPGWPFKVGILQAGVLPLVGEGITGAPVIGVVRCNGGLDRQPRVGVIPAAGVPYLVNADGQSCYGRDSAGKDVNLPTQGGLASDQPFIPAFGHPAFGKVAGQDAFLAPAAGLQRAIDVVLPDYQGGKDYLVAWQTLSGRIAPGWPAEMNDLQFLTGPALADVDGVTGDEVLAASANDDLQGFTGAGTDISTSWPKLTGDWTVSVPAIGAFGAGARKVVVSLTRSGRILAYETASGACAGAVWPQFHHDPRNSGDSRVDAVAPGRPTGARIETGTLVLNAPGDDGACGTVASYEVVTSDGPIDEASFAAARRLYTGGTPVAAGARQTLSLPAAETLGRYVGVRARDEQGNVGRPASVRVG
jgi:hypothetical protein